MTVREAKNTSSYAPHPAGPAMTGPSTIAGEGECNIGALSLRHIQINETTQQLAGRATFGRGLQIDEDMTPPAVGILAGRTPLRFGGVVTICAFPVGHRRSPMNRCEIISMIRLQSKKHGEDHFSFQSRTRYG
jgi:hypothetical protein